MTPHCCPVCEGRGTMPAGWYQRAATLGSLAPDTCRSCEGKGFLWSEPPAPAPPDYFLNTGVRIVLAGRGGSSNHDPAGVPVRISAGAEVLGPTGRVDAKYVDGTGRITCDFVVVKLDQGGEVSCRREDVCVLAPG